MKKVYDLFNYLLRGRQKRRLHHILSPKEFWAILEQERARADRIGYMISLVIFHLGNGEDGGAIAEDLARLLECRIRLSDKMGWWSENGIGVILTGTAAEGAWKFADDICKRMSVATSSLALKIYTYPSQWLSHNNKEVLQLDGMEKFFVRRTSIWKRCMDIVGSTFGLIIFSPLMLALAIAIKTTSPGPIFYKQERVGLLGRKFTFLKFRSMDVNENPNLHKDYVQKFIKKEVSQKRDERTISTYKIIHDPRITPVGMFLRKTSLDELPQLINVLKGEMSLVGPRPPIYYECEHYDHWHKWRILPLKPGMTGLWQVKGRSRVAFDEMVRLDLKYIREWSLWRDIKILLQTPSAVLSGKGAY